MSRNEIIISNKILIADVLSRKIDYLIRIGDKNKWTNGTIFDMKESFTSKTSIPVRIISSEKVYVDQLSFDILTRCGYQSQAKFKSQWEDWFQTWDIFATAWLIHFELYIPLKDNNCDDIFA